MGEKKQCEAVVFCCISKKEFGAKVSQTSQIIKTQRKPIKMFYRNEETSSYIRLICCEAKPYRFSSSLYSLHAPFINQKKKS